VYNGAGVDPSWAGCNAESIGVECGVWLG